ncbi:hypothetical protein [Chondromyces apiculatus]|nr:hypothetical protein [Chondromyces apiculatus]
MKSDPRGFIQEWHRLQRDSGSCVAACRAIVDARSGGEGEETSGYPALEGEFLDPSLAENVDLLVARVRRHSSAIVTVDASSWMVLARLRKMRSPYGDLDRGLHAIVIVAVDGVGKMLVAIDPYFPREFQPVNVSRDDFVAVWSGEVEFVEL